MTLSMLLAMGILTVPVVLVWYAIEDDKLLKWCLLLALAAAALLSLR
jgi:hypothetical protein